MRTQALGFSLYIALLRWFSGARYPRHGSDGNESGDLLNRFTWGQEPRPRPVGVAAQQVVDVLLAGQVTPPL